MVMAAAPSMESSFTAINASLARSSGKAVTFGLRPIALATWRKSRASARVMFAEVAADISEEDRPQERHRLVRAFTKAAGSGARVAGRGTRAVRSGADRKSTR